MEEGFVKVVQEKNHVMEEEMQSCLPIICINQDPLMGNGQRNTTFRDIIALQQTSSKWKNTQVGKELGIKVACCET
jgi:hypothetical protein